MRQPVQSKPDQHTFCPNLFRWLASVAVYPVLRVWNPSAAARLLASGVIIGMVITGTAHPQPPGSTQTYQKRLQAFPTAGLPLYAGAEIYWNRHQVPFIRADDDRDLPFLLGMVHAHLRLAQMELLRRVSQGRLAEIFGPFLSDVDHSIRMIDYDRAVPGIVSILPDATLKWIDRYTEGINFYQANASSLSPDLKTMAIKPETWTIEEILTLGRLGSTDVNWLYWFRNLRLREEPRWADVWNRLVAYGKASIPSFQTDAGTSLQLLQSAVKSGSNSYAIAGRHTDSGSSLLANDPHLGLMLPNLWVIVAYKSPGYHAVGLSIPGLPAVLVGRNPDIAWGGTNMLALSSTFYDISDADYEPLDERKEVITSRWWFDREVTVRNSALGPVISDSKYLQDQGLPRLALKWRGHEPSDEITAFLKVNQADSWQAFRKAWQTYAVSGQNMIYADRQGNIGQVLAVEFIPAASVASRRLIADPSKPAHQWDKRLKSTGLPSVFNPPSGYLISTNNVPVKIDPPVSFFGNSNDRYRTIEAQLQHAMPVALKDLKRIQTDVFSGKSFDLAQAIARQARAEGIENNELLKHLDRWSGNYDIDSAGAAALELAAFHLANDYYKPLYGEQPAEYVMRSPAVYTFLYEDMSKPGLQNVLKTALEKAASDFEKYPTWGKLHYLRLRHPLGNIPLFGGPYRFGEYPAPGSTNTVMKRAHPLINEKHYTTYGANARHISDLADMDENYFVLVGGQDGHTGSENFLDLFELWQNGRYIRVPLRLETVRQTFGHHMDFSAGQPF